MNALKRTIHVALVAIAVGFLTACPAKKDDNNGSVGQPVPPYGVPGCPGCPPGTGQNLALAFGQHSPSTLALGLNFTAVGSPTSQPGLPPGYQVNPGYYAGPVVASGEMFVTGQSSYTCPMVPGVYVINSIQPGQWQANMFGGLRVNAVGPSNVILNIYRGGVYQAVPEVNYQGRRFPNNMWAEVIVESVNGYPCPQIPYFVSGF